MTDGLQKINEDLTAENEKLKEERENVLKFLNQELLSAAFDVWDEGYRYAINLIRDKFRIEYKEIDNGMLYAKALDYIAELKQTITHKDEAIKDLNKNWLDRINILVAENQKLKTEIDLYKPFATIKMDDLRRENKRLRREITVIIDTYKYSAETDVEDIIACLEKIIRINMGSLLY